MTGRRRSSTRCVSRVVSERLSSSSWNGGVTDGFSTRISCARISISPDFIVGLTVPSGRLRTTPRTSTQYSLRSDSAVANVSARSGSQTICAMPSRSRRSMKMTPPWSRRRCTQPSSTTGCASCSAVTRPQYWVRMKAPKVGRPRGWPALDVRVGRPDRVGGRRGSGVVRDACRWSAVANDPSDFGPGPRSRRVDARAPDPARGARRRAESGGSCVASFASGGNYHAPATPGNATTGVAGVRRRSRPAARWSSRGRGGPARRRPSTRRTSAPRRR